MSCNCRTIVGALGKKVKIIEFSFVPDTTAFTAGDALYASPTEIRDVFDFDNGNGKVLEFTVENHHATTVTKKGISAYLFHTLPASTAVAINAAESISATDFPKLCGKVSVVTADYADSAFASNVVTIASRTSNTDDLPIIWNNDTSAKSSLWVKLVVDEAATYSSSGLMHVKIVVECF
jgi:hypothetical protein